MRNLKNHINLNKSALIQAGLFSFNQGWGHVKLAKEERSNQTSSAEKPTSLGNFWAGFFEPQQEKAPKGFWYPKSGPDEQGASPVILANHGQRDVIVPGEYG
jgi:hypothetical protein